MPKTITLDEVILDVRRRKDSTRVTQLHRELQGLDWNKLLES